MNGRGLHTSETREGPEVGDSLTGTHGHPHTKTQAPPEVESTYLL